MDNIDENLRYEADFLHEAENMDRARQDFASFGDAVHVPQVFWEHTTKRCLGLAFFLLLLSVCIVYLI